MLKFFICKRKVCNFFNLVIIIYIFLQILINNQGKQTKVLKKSTIHCYSYQVKKQFYHMNGMTAIVSDSEKRCECRRSSVFVSY